MNTHFHRKQVVILVLAMALAAASYWIPLPRQADIQSSPSPSRMLGPIDQVALKESMAYAREPATIWRFPVTVQAPQTSMQAATRQSAHEALSVPSSPEKRWISQQDFMNGDRIPTQRPLLAPVKGLDPSVR